MNTKITFKLAAAAMLIALAGCAGHHPHGGPDSLTAEQVQNWNEAAAKYKACNQAWREHLVASAPQFNQLANSLNDPQYLQKMSSRAPVEKGFKEALIKYRPEQMACRKVLFDTLGNQNPAVSAMYTQNFRTLDSVIVGVLDGKLKTMGEVNQAYVNFNNEVSDRKTRLTARSSRN